VTHPDSLTWRKAKRSTGQNDCIEVAQTPGAVLIRDSKNPGGGHLAVATRIWEAFVTRVKNGSLA
jgi:hypothetical protein